MGFFDIFSFKEKDDRPEYRQDRYSGEKGSSQHEHTWSKTTAEDGGHHKEGWVGENFGRSRD